MVDYVLGVFMMRLDCYRFNITSQYGENGIIAYLLSAFPNIPRVCLEVGASDGVTNSNTNPLWTSGWRALLIESDAGQYRELRQRADGYDVTAVNTLIEPVGDNSLDAIAERHGFPISASSRSTSIVATIGSSRT